MPAWLALRLGLLLLTVVGVAGMHTLGHASAGGHGGSEKPVAAHMGSEPSGDSMVVAAAVALMAAPVEAVTPAGVGMRGDGMLLNPLVMCLAILAAGLVVLLAALRPAHPDHATPTCPARASAGAAGRGPPTRPLVGLHLTTLSVQRN